MPVFLPSSEASLFGQRRSRAGLNFRETDERAVLPVLRSGVWSRAKVVAEAERQFARLMGAKPLRGDLQWNQRDHHRGQGT